MTGAMGPKMRLPCGGKSGQLPRLAILRGQRMDSKPSSPSRAAASRTAQDKPGAASTAEAPVDSPPTGARKWAALLIVGGAIYMVTLDSGAVNVALPTIAAEFAAPLVTVQWVVLGYLVCITALLLPAGRLADLVGRRRVFLIGLALFASSSALCGLAPSLGLLVAARVVQGIAAALLQANIDPLVVTAFPTNERGRALGMIGTVVSIGLLTGPALGGAVTQALGWRWIFGMTVPLGLATTLLGRRLLPRTPTQPGQRPDPIGAALLIVTVVCLVLGLNRGPLVGWTAASAGGLLVVAGVAGGAFLLVQRRVEHPTVQLALFRSRGVTAAVGASWLSFLSQANLRLLLPFLLQQLLGRPAGQAGFIQAAQPATVMFLSPLTGWLSDRLGSRWLASSGMALQVIGMLALTTVSVDTAVWQVVAVLVLLGFGTGLFNAPNSNALYKAAPREHYGLLGGLRALSRNLGWVLGQGAAGALWTAAVVGAGGGVVAAAASPAAMTAGFRATFFLAAGLALIGLFLSAVVRPRDPAAPPA